MNLIINLLFITHVVHNVNAFSLFTVNSPQTFVTSPIVSSSSSCFNPRKYFNVKKMKLSSSSRLFYKDNDYTNNNNDDHNNNNNNNNKSITKHQNNHHVVRRTSIKGISVSPNGFLMLLETTSTASTSTSSTSIQSKIDNDDHNDDTVHKQKNIIIPIRITSTIKDAFATTSPESLTICQLLSGVDMAGAIFSPDVLKHLVGLYCSPSHDDYDSIDNDLDVIMIEDELGLEIVDDSSSSSCSNKLNSESLSSSSSSSSSSSVKEFVHQFISTSLSTFSQSNNMIVNSFEEANQYQRSRVIFPSITLDSITIDLPSFINHDNSDDNTFIDRWSGLVLDTIHDLDSKKYSDDDGEYGKIQQNQINIAHVPLQFTLECRIDGNKKLNIPLFSEIMYEKNNDDSTMSLMFENRHMMEEVLYSYDDKCSGAFLSMALARRYKCPIEITSRALDAIQSVQCRLEEGKGINEKEFAVCIEQKVDSESNFDDQNRLQQVLPQWRSTTKLQKQSQRVVENIEQGFQITKLQGALKIAVQRGDDIAADKIRAEIDKLLGENE